MSAYNRTGYTYLSLLDDGIKFSIKGGALGKIRDEENRFLGFLLNFQIVILRRDTE